MLSFLSQRLFQTSGTGCRLWMIVAQFKLRDILRAMAQQRDKGPHGLKADIAPLRAV
jgi:hypothetical protein